ncbi:tRNA (adenine-N1)-methyltransferase [Nanoarchaeota archaeon]
MPTRTPKAKILVRKGQKQFFEDLNREVTIVKEKHHYVADISKDFSTAYGTIKKADLKKTGKIKTHTKKEFNIFDASFIDIYKRIKRLPQIIPLKDIGFMIAKTGIGKESIVVEGGAGSGALSIMLSRYCKKVYSYEIKPEHLEVVKNNIKSLNIKNITLKNKSMYDKIAEKDVDLVCLDLPEPWNAIGPAAKALKQGGFIINYSPTIMQTADFVNALLKRDDFIHLETAEIIERKWEVEKRKVRPISKANIHSGFLSIGRRI